MPLVLALATALGLGSFLSSNALQGTGLPGAPAAPSDLNSQVPSPYTLAIYAAGGLGLYWLYRKAKHA